MNTLGLFLLILGFLVTGMGMLDLRWGNKSWRLRLLIGIVVTVGGISFVTQ
jgi:hypothetical protein